MLAHHPKELCDARPRHGRPDRVIRAACGSTRFSGVCPVLPESDSYRPKSLASLRADNRLTQRSKQISSFDHLVSLGEHQNWDLKAEGVSGLEIDHQFYLGALLDWEVSRLGALENFSDVGPCLLI